MFRQEKTTTPQLGEVKKNRAMLRPKEAPQQRFPRI